MPAAKPPSKSKAPAAAVPLRSPDGWQLNTAFGYMACDNSPSGRLVRLADVLRWIESTTALPRVEALKILIDAMRAEVFDCLYWVQTGDYARPVPKEYGFGYKSVENTKKDAIDQRHEEMVLARQQESFVNRQDDGGCRTPRISFVPSRRFPEDEPSTPSERALPALLRALIRHWNPSNSEKPCQIDILDNPGSGFAILTNLSILLNKAEKLWGYGQELTVGESRMETFSDLATYRKANKGAEWLPVHLEILRKYAFENRGVPGFRANMAFELGISVTAVNNKIREEYRSKRAAVFGKPQ